MTTPPQPSASPAFTPGPWKVTPLEHASFVYMIQTDNYIIANVWAHFGAREERHELALIDHANAELIASAPRLHAANRELRDALKIEETWISNLIGDLVQGRPLNRDALRANLDSRRESIRAALTRHAPNGAEQRRDT